MQDRFNFRIVKDGSNTWYDFSRSTPYDSLTPEGMIEYINADNKIAKVESQERRKSWNEAEHSLLYSIVTRFCMNNVANLK